METLDRANPIAAGIYFLSAAGISMFCMNPVILSLSFIGALAFYLCRGGANIKTHLYSLLLFTVMAIINPLVNHNGATVLFVMNDKPITLEALIYGITASLMITAVLYHFRSFTEIMTSDKLLYIFGGFSPQLALVLSMALRFVPLFTRQIGKTENAQRAMGLYKDDNIADTFKGKLNIFSIIITWGLENGIITADSMSARGYGTGKRSRYSLFRIRGGDILLIIVTAALAAVTLYGIVGSEFIYYPYFEAPALTVRNVTGYASYGILAILPTILEIKEAVRWKYLRSKI